MPELPEVETTVRDLKKKVLKRTFIDVWTDFSKMIKKPSFKQFKKEIKGKKIKNVWRRGKNVIFDLTENKTLLIHQKLTGHLLLGKWELKKGQWQSKIKGPLLEDPRNRFLHLIFWLDNEKMFALSDLRKFAKIELWGTEKFRESEGIKALGPEPLDKNFTFKKFSKTLKEKKTNKGEYCQRRGKLKQVLLDQTIIAGIGNIYSDEILWKAKIHPLKEISKLNQKELKRIYKAIKTILKKAIKLRGESISDYRDIKGKKGYFDSERKVYQRKGESCLRCGAKIERIKITGRGAHFCPKCQKNK
ncbi:bifunctional DNA-formamidopyrimidine glycosylase/DNA-(apurinic or apyrimidinic site) lyase [Patescibacteria group bacterium]